MANQGSHDVSVIDAASNTEIDTDGNPDNGMNRIPVSAGYYAIDLNANTNLVYVTDSASDVIVIDGGTNTVATPTLTFVVVGTSI